MHVLLADTPELSPNLGALPLVRQLIEKSEQLRVATRKIGNVTVLDCGVKAEGGWQAGVLFAGISLGGLAEVRLGWGDFGGLHWPCVEVVTDHPIRACLASQYAGWIIKREGYSAMGSGPARAVVRSEDLFAKLGYADSSRIAILCLESSRLPTEEAVNWIVGKCGCEAENVYILVAPTASPAGSVQIAARSVETGLHKLMELGYDIGLIESGWGISPVAPVAGDDIRALGRTNDAILYGTTVQYTLCDDDDVLRSLIQKIPSASSRDYGVSFEQLVRRYGNFYDIDPLLFSPAKVWLNNKKSGRSFHCGKIRSDILTESFQLEA